MKLYTTELKEEIRNLRRKGYTYTEIQVTIGQKIPKGTLSYICKDISLSSRQQGRIDKIMQGQLVIKQQKAVKANRQILLNKIAGYRQANIELVSFMQDRRAKLLALAILYLGEGAKWQGNRSLKLGSSDPGIIRLYIALLHDCYDIQLDQLRCRVQHRADQNSDVLVNYWSGVAGIGKDQFYPSYIDKRSIGKPTLKTNYKGVCTVSCSGTHIQLELAEIADIIIEAVGGISAAG